MSFGRFPRGKVTLILVSGIYQMFPKILNEEGLEEG